jgi:hypothetical protein
VTVRTSVQAPRLSGRPLLLIASLLLLGEADAARCFCESGSQGKGFGRRGLGFVDDAMLEAFILAQTPSESRACYLPGARQKAPRVHWSIYAILT